MWKVRIHPCFVFVSEHRLTTCVLLHYISSFPVNLSFHTSNTMETLDQIYPVFHVAGSTDRTIVLEVDGEGESALRCSSFRLLLCAPFHPSFFLFCTVFYLLAFINGDLRRYVKCINFVVILVLDLRFLFPLNPMVPQITR